MANTTLDDLKPLPSVPVALAREHRVFFQRLLDAIHELQLLGVEGANSINSLLLDADACGIGEAPINGGRYCRQNGQWVDVDYSPALPNTTNDQWILGDMGVGG